MKNSMETVLCIITLVLLQIGVAQAASVCNAAANGFVTNDTCDMDKIACVGCFKVFPESESSVYETMFCTESGLIDSESEGLYTCPNPCDDFCWVSYSVMNKYNLYTEGHTHLCVPHTGGDGDGVIPNWCHAPQGQMEFFTVCNDSSITYTCNKTLNLFRNNFDVLTDIHVSRSSFSCSGNEAEETLRRCISSNLALFISDVTTPCTDVVPEMKECYIDFESSLVNVCPNTEVRISNLSIAISNNDLDYFLTYDSNLILDITNCLKKQLPFG